MEDIDGLLLDTIDEVLRYVLGDKSTDRFFEYLERRSCLKSEIPSKLDLFSSELRIILSDKPYGGRFTDRISGVGKMAIMERTIARLLYRKLGKKFKETGPVDLSSLVLQLKRTLNHGSKEEYSPVRKVVRAAQVQSTHFMGDKESRISWLGKYFKMVRVSSKEGMWNDVSGAW